MPNMSYCRFRNTVQDLRDCNENWHDSKEDPLSPDKAVARDEMLQLIEDMYYEHCEENEDARLEGGD